MSSFFFTFFIHYVISFWLIGFHIIWKCIFVELIIRNITPRAWPTSPPTILKKAYLAYIGGWCPLQLGGGLGNTLPWHGHFVHVVDGIVTTLCGHDLHWGELLRIVVRVFPSPTTMLPCPAVLPWLTKRPCVLEGSLILKAYNVVGGHLGMLYVMACEWLEKVFKKIYLRGIYSSSSMANVSSCHCEKSIFSIYRGVMPPALGGGLALPKRNNKGGIFFLEHGQCLLLPLWKKHI